ncbi:MAG TPA: outer membrane lipoprotein-sorting protein [Atribacteraceae bacterium]|nr:outer membrane lipoprotein-sorting protein [Atribacteraceae bacterium]
MRRTLVFSILFLLTMAILTLPTLAMTADQIFDEMEARQPDIETSRSTGSLIVVDARGNEEKREMIMFSQEEGDDTTSSIFRFLSPASVRDITLLSLNDGDQIYLFMPAFRRVRRIAGAGRQETFAGTDFTYEDVGGMAFQREDFNYTLIGEDEQNYYLALIPLDEESEYSKQVMTVDREKFYLRKMEFYDLEGALWRVLEIHEIEVRDDGTNRFKKLSLTDVKENTKTLMNMGEVEENITLPAGFFSVRTIQRPEL